MKRGQVWIETVIYTLIAFIIIGLVLSFVKPKVEEIRDRSSIEQTIKVMDYINTRVMSVAQGGSGNQRVDNLELKKGTLKIDGINEKIVFEMQSKYEYSEPGKNINYGNIIILTNKTGDSYLITLTNNYIRDYNITYEGSDQIKTITKGSVPYKMIISNRGVSNDKILINFEIN